MSDFNAGWQVPGRMGRPVTMQFPAQAQSGAMPGGGFGQPRPSHLPQMNSFRPPGVGPSHYPDPAAYTPHSSYPQPAASHPAPPNISAAPQPGRFVPLAHPRSAANTPPRPNSASPELTHPSSPLAAAGPNTAPRSLSAEGSPIGGVRPPPRDSRQPLLELEYHEALAISAPPAPPREGSAEGGGGMSGQEEEEEGKLAEVLDQLKQQRQLYQMDHVGKEVWEALLKDVGETKPKATAQTDKQELEELEASINEVLESKEYQMTTRLRSAEAELDKVQSKLEEGGMGSMSTEEYEEMISKVGQLQVEREELLQQGVKAGAEPAARIDGQVLVEALRGMKQSAAEQRMCVEEETFAQRLSASQFALFRAPNDGDCLFYSAFVSKLALDTLKRCRTALGHPGMSLPELEGRVRAFSNQELASGAIDMRLQAMDTMRANPEKYLPGIREALALAFQGAADVTSQKLRHEATQTLLPGRALLGEEATTEELMALLESQPDDELVRVYTAVMGNPGIFGEKNEVLALSTVLGRKLHLYYFHGERVDGKGVFLPAESFTPSGKCGGREVNILHSVSGRHFSPLVRRDWLKKEPKVQEPLEFNGFLPPGTAGAGLSLKTITEESGTTHLQICEVHKGSGAAAQHVLKNDVLRAIDGASLSGKTMYEVQELLLGPVGSVVRLELERPKKGKYNCNVTRLPNQQSTAKGLLKGVTKGVKGAFSLSSA